VNSQLSLHELSGPGLELENSLNRMTAQAEVAVQDSDPVQFFLRTFSSQDKSGRTHYHEM
jgi:hypothetical protein